jgi:hypothetical protein
MARGGMKVAIRPQIILALDLVRPAGDVADLACVEASAEVAGKVLRSGWSSRKPASGWSHESAG